MTSIKSKEELEIENRLLKRSNKKEGFVSILNNLIKYGFLAWLAYFIAKHFCQ